MQEACENTNGTMAAILGLENKVIEQTCESISGTVIPANYNCPGQVVISGEIKSVADCCEKLKDKGARRAITLPVSGAFHSVLMESAKEKLNEVINQIDFNEPICPIYQNVNAKASIDKNQIKKMILTSSGGPFFGKSIAHAKHLGTCVVWSLCPACAAFENSSFNLTSNSVANPKPLRSNTSIMIWFSRAPHIR